MQVSRIMKLNNQLDMEKQSEMSARWQKDKYKKWRRDN